MSIKDLETTITNALIELRQLANDGNSSTKVEVGRVLWDAVNNSTKVLDPIKKYFRDKARDQLPGKGHTKFAGSDRGVCRVVIADTQYRLHKDTEIEQLKDLLGEFFPVFFEAKTTYIPRKQAIAQGMNSLDAPQMVALTNAIEQQEPTPRVSFRLSDKFDDDI